MAKTHLSMIVTLLVSTAFAQLSSACNDRVFGSDRAVKLWNYLEDKGSQNGESEVRQRQRLAAKIASTKAIIKVTEEAPETPEKADALAGLQTRLDEEQHEYEAKTNKVAKEEEALAPLFSPAAFQQIKSFQHNRSAALEDEIQQFLTDADYKTIEVSCSRTYGGFGRGL